MNAFYKSNIRKKLALDTIDDDDTSDCEEIALETSDDKDHDTKNGGMIKAAFATGNCEEIALDTSDNKDQQRIFACCRSQ